MPMPRSSTVSVSTRDRAQWLALVDQLVGEVEAWAKARNWAVHRDQKVSRESRLGEYIVPVLSILAPAGRIQIDPVARYIAGGDGRIDLLSWPSLTRMLLIRAGDQWVLKTDSGVEWPEGWNQQTFARLVELLSAAA
jgi:hypothetical protein